jgi:hypothetical protein
MRLKVLRDWYEFPDPIIGACIQGFKLFTNFNQRSLEFIGADNLDGDEDHNVRHLKQGFDQRKIIIYFISRPIASDHMAQSKTRRPYLETGETKYRA